MARRVEAHGGNVTYRTNTDGSQSPYELNIVYFDALNDPRSDEGQDLQVARFLCSQAILLSLAGVPGIYVHSLFGSRNWTEGVAETGRYRTINRRKFDRGELEADLSDTGSVPHQVFAGYSKLLERRTNEPAFHPAGDQQVLAVNSALFALLRTSPDMTSQVLCIHNVTDEEVHFALDTTMLDLAPTARVTDILSGSTWATGEDGGCSFSVPAYGILWLKTE